MSGRPAGAEPVAVVGLACRMPGAPDLNAFWELLSTGTDAIGPPPPGRENRRAGGYVDDTDRFDAAFFGIPPAEAAAMDPQQRLLLESAWHALEDARIPADAAGGPGTAVFVGACADDYAFLTRGHPDDLGAYTMTGIGRTFLANRLSFVLGAEGPSLTIDTGQSSSLTALDRAVRSLRDGECTTAIVAGVQLNLSAGGDAVVDALGALSPTGRCRTFSAEADGIVRGEGVGVVVLKPLSAALADGDRVYCQVLAGAVNNGGRAEGLTVPRQEAQQRLLRAAYDSAGVNPAEVSYVELHGTGTRLGDPLEAAALGEVFAPGRGAEPLLVGSVKTNVGHLEGAAGIAGFIKTALALFHRSIPPSLHGAHPSPRIDFAGLRLRLCTDAEALPADRPLLAGVSSFGLGGSNCHLVLASAPEPAVPTAPPTVDALTVVLSARGPAALAARAGALADALDTADPADLGLSTAVTRARLTDRAAVSGASVADLRAGLRSLQQGQPTEAVVRGQARPGAVAFLFSGQGGQRAGMGRELYQAYPRFAAAFDEVCEALRQPLGYDLKTRMWGSDDLTEHLDVAQPALFALEVALHRLLQDWGIVPGFVLGHSQGEISVAYVAGVLSLDDACELIVRRGQLIDSLPAGGAMVAVEAQEHEALAMLAGAATGVSIAAVNSPQSLVLSGATDAVLAAAGQFEAMGRRTRRLRIARAGHSPLMDPITDDLLRVAQGLQLRPPSGPSVISTVSGAVAVPADLGSAHYWPAHLRRTVRFGAAVQTAYELGARFFVEVGPGRGLATMLQETLGADDLTVVAPLGVHDDVTGVASVAGHAYVAGLEVDWRAVHGPRARTVDLPLYPFRRDRHWLGSPVVPPVPEAETNHDMEAVVVERLGSVLGQPTAFFDLQHSFRDLGLDSRMSVALRNELASVTGRPLPATLLFDYPTPEQLIRALEAGSVH